MKLSVIIPNYNHGQWIGEQLESIFNQTYKCHEIIIIDDKSTDQSVELIKDLIKDESTAYLVESMENEGPLNTLNKGLLLSTGNYIYFPSADDRICENLFEEAFNLFSKHPDVGVFSGLGYQMDKDGRFENLITSPLISTDEMYLTPETVKRYLVNHGDWIVGQTMIFRKSCFEDLEIMFDPNLRHYSDIFVPLVISSKYGACFSPKTLASWRYYSGYAEQNFADRDGDAIVFDKFKELCRSPRYRDLVPEGLLSYMDHSKRIMYINRRFFGDQQRSFLRRTIIDRFFKFFIYLYVYRLNFFRVFRILWGKRRYKIHRIILDPKLIK